MMRRVGRDRDRDRRREGGFQREEEEAHGNDEEEQRNQLLRRLLHDIFIIIPSNFNASQTHYKRRRSRVVWHKRARKSRVGSPDRVCLLKGKKKMMRDRGTFLLLLLSNPRARELVACVASQR